MLVGQLDNFPPVAQQKIQEAGGLKPFLLESLRFVMMGHRIGLSKHAVSMHQAGHGLNDLDVIGDNDMNPSTLDCHPGQESVFTSYLHDSGSGQPEAYTPLPSPYGYGSQLPPSTWLTNGVAGTVGNLRGDDELSHWTTACKVPGYPLDPPYYSANNLDDLDLYVGEVDEGGFGETTLSSEGNTMKKPAAEQVSNNISPAI